METHAAGRSSSPELDARPRIRPHRGVLVGARGDGGRRPWRCARRRDAHRPVGPCRVASVDPRVARPALLRHRESCCSSRSGGTRWRSTYRSAWSSTGSRSRSSCSCGWPHCSSIRRFAFGAHRWMGRSRSSSRRRSAPSPSTTGVWRLLRRQFSRVSSSSFPSSSCSISSPASSRALPRVVLVTQFIVSGVGVVAFFAIIEQRTGFNVFDHVRSVLPFLQFERG